MNFRLSVSILSLFTFSLLSCRPTPDNVSLSVYYTSDVHGTIFDHDLKRESPTRSSLANAAYYIREARQQDKEIILLDNGDFLQGQPHNYYYNFIDTTCTNLTAEVMNYLQYDAASVGNHDIEAGHPVYDKVVRELQFPWLSANSINTATGECYFQPYTVLHKKGLKIAVLGMTTPGIYKWLPKKLWHGIDFQDMIETARHWVKKIQDTEHPDLLIGLFHSGYNFNYAGENAQTPRNENAGVLVAQEVEGFDIVLLGHDHQTKQMEVTNRAGRKVVILDPKSHAAYLGKITVNFKREGKSYRKDIATELIDLSSVPTDSAYLTRFSDDLEKMKKYVSTEIGEFSAPLSGRDGLFGPAVFTDFIHEVQLKTTGADISFTSVLQKDAHIKAGKITVRDMFNLYTYENGLYVMEFTGEEIKNYLEYAYALQYNTMRSPNEHLLRLKADTTGKPVKNSRGQYSLASEFFNYSCAAGIKYTVNVSKKPGERVKIQSLSDGKPFDPKKTYKVSINSYRGNGGGGHLSQGLGWSKEEMEKRIVEIKPLSVRHYITEYIQKQKTLNPQCRNDWKVIPEAWFKKGKEKDYKLMYTSH